MRWWPSRKLRAAAGAALGRRRVQVLAQGHGQGIVVLGLVDGMALGRGDQWEMVDWHLIRQGGWNEQLRTLSWVLADDRAGSVVLSEPGRIPEMFQERVKATIVVEDRTPAPGGGAVVLVGRRALGTTAPTDAHIVWQVVTEGGARIGDPAVREHILARVTVLDSDYSV